MREHAPREFDLLALLNRDGKRWSYAPLRDREEVPKVRLSRGVTVPERFGSWWREFDAETDEPTGREVELWLRTIDGVPQIHRITFQGFPDEFERQGVPQMRDITIQITALMAEHPDGGTAFAMTSAGPQRRDEVLREVQRRRRGNARSHEQIAELYRQGGAKAIKNATGAGESTVYRWIKEAREAGVLEPRRGRS